MTPKTFMLLLFIFIVSIWIWIEYKNSEHENNILMKSEIKGVIYKVFKKEE